MIKKIRIIFGLLKTFYLRLRYNVHFQEILILLFSEYNNFNIDRGKKLVMMVGFCKSGKETLRKDNESFQKYAIVDTDKIHRLLNKKIPGLQDDNTVEGKAYWVRQFLTHYLRQKVYKFLLEDGFSILSDSCNLVKKDRKKYLLLATKYGYSTSIIWVKCSEVILISRLKEADSQKILKNESPAWEDLYLNVQKERFEEPSKDEASKIIEFESDSLKKVKELII